MLDIDPNDHSEDFKIAFLNEQGSNLIEEVLGGRDLLYKTRTQIYRGTNTQKLLLKNRPVYPNPSLPFLPINVVYDDQAYYGSAPGAFTTNATVQNLVYGTDYALEIDTDDGLGSRSGILIRINNYWNKQQVRQAGLLSPFIQEDWGSYQVQYTAGYSIDTLPASFRLAANLLVARLLTVLPLGAETSSEGYEERSLSVVTSEKLKLLALIAPLISPYRNWKFF